MVMTMHLIIGAPGNVRITYKGEAYPLTVDGRVAKFKLPKTLTSNLQRMSAVKPTIKRRESTKIYVGNVPIGGDAPIAVQSMTNTRTTDVEATVA